MILNYSLKENHSSYFFIKQNKAHMKNILLTTFFLLFTVLVGAQDLIVTNQGDSINCCAELNKKRNQYRIGTKREYGIFWSKIPKEKVSVYIKDFYKKTPSVRLLSSKKPEELPKWRFAIGLGLGERTFKYMRNSSFFHKGLALNIEANYFFHPNLGVGLLYESFYNSEKIFNNKISTQIHNFIPTLIFRIPISDGQNVFYGSYGLGHSIYKIVHKSKKQKATFFSQAICAAYDFKISKSFTTGLKIAYILGEVSDESLNHFSLTIGFRYLLW